MASTCKQDLLPFGVGGFFISSAPSSAKAKAKSTANCSETVYKALGVDSSHDLCEDALPGIPHDCVSCSGL